MEAKCVTVRIKTTTTTTTTSIQIIRVACFWGVCVCVCVCVRVCVWGGLSTYPDEKGSARENCAARGSRRSSPFQMGDWRSGSSHGRAIPERLVCTRTTLHQDLPESSRLSGQGGALQSRIQLKTFIISSRVEICGANGQDVTSSDGDRPHKQLRDDKTPPKRVKTQSGVKDY